MKDKKLKVDFGVPEYPNCKKCGREVDVMEYLARNLSYRNNMCFGCTIELEKEKTKKEEGTKNTFGRLQWAMKFEGNIIDKIRKLNLKDDQGVVTYDTDYFPPAHRIDNFGERVVVACMRHNLVKYVHKEAGFVPIYVGKIVSFEGDYVNHIIGDLYADTKHLQRFWSLKRKWKGFTYKFKWYYRWRIKKIFDKTWELNNG